LIEGINIMIEEKETYLTIEYLSIFKSE